jgi:hypothetical protein
MYSYEPGCFFLPLSRLTSNRQSESHSAPDLLLALALPGDPTTSLTALLAGDVPTLRSGEPPDAGRLAGDAPRPMLTPAAVGAWPCYIVSTALRPKELLSAHLVRGRLGLRRRARRRHDDVAQARRR